MTVQSDMLHEIAATVGGERNKDYGPPRLNLDDRTARLWNTYLMMTRERPLNGMDVCNMMILLKMARTMQDQYVKDSWADIAGYAAAAWEIAHDNLVDPGF